MQSRIVFIASGGLTAHSILIHPPQRSHFKCQNPKRVSLTQPRYSFLDGL
jgi:hypothetical protein